MSGRAPKQWALGKNETINSFERWRANIQYTLSLDENFAPFLLEGVKWKVKSKDDPKRGFSDDTEGARKKTAAQKVSQLELMLGQISNYCPVISRQTIIKKCVSVPDVWQTIRLHYGFQSSGSHFLDLADMKLEGDERPEDLYQRILAFVEDNLLTTTSTITHNGEVVSEDEEITPTLENMIVLTWLKLVHKDLPRLVKQRYGTELRSKTLSTIKPEISQALESLLDEIRTGDDAKVFRFNASGFQTSKFHTKGNRSLPGRGKLKKVCPLCKQAGRVDGHFLSQCSFLPDSDKRYMAKTRQIVNIVDSADEIDSDDEDIVEQVPPRVCRVQVRQSPYVDAFYDHHAIRIVIDSGATGNMIRRSTARRLGVKITKTSQSASQADGSSPLHISGETRFTLTHGGSTFQFEGLVTDSLDVDILGGTPFMEVNDITIRPAKRQVILADGSVVQYGSSGSKNDSGHKVRRALVLRASDKSASTIWPEDYIEVDVPDEYVNNEDAQVAIESRRVSVDETLWPHPDMYTSVAGKVRIPNLSSQPQTLKRGEHFCQVNSVFVPDTSVRDHSSPTQLPSKPLDNDHHKVIAMDPDNILDKSIRDRFHEVNSEFREVFNPKFDGYNGSAGSFKGKVNMGPVQPPQRKGRCPQYARDKLVELQQKFDELEDMGVFKKPEEVDINVEYLNPSFLVKKKNGSFRLVTAFSDVGRYSKPQPSLMPDVDSTLRQIAQWQYVIQTDLSNAFYQIPLSKDSMKYCGVATPFKGVRVYVRCAMGMPGSETALEELMCRVLGNLLEEGCIAKLADDLYCGGNTQEELLENWRKVLRALYDAGLRLSAVKTIIAPKSSMILGWKWQQGTLQASSHRISTLASCKLPENVCGLRSFIGAYKVLARVIPHCASIIAPLDSLTAGKDTKDNVTWTDEMKKVFTDAQSALSTRKSIMLPRVNDQLWVVTDGSVKHSGVGATLYVNRNDKLHIAGFFSVKLRDRQVRWLPCEIEALAIAAAIRHFSPYMIHSQHHTCILTDSKPCVQAYEKLCRGEFSASPRVSTFLSTVSRYQASVRHIAGVANVPSDHASRNSIDCIDETCQVCGFVQRTEDSVVMKVSVEDVVSGNARLPYTSRPAWIAIQSECPSLKRTHAYLSQGTRPNKKMTDIRDVKRYLNVATVSRDGLLVVNRDVPFFKSRECIVVPRSVVDGLLMSIHITLDHPTAHQLRKVVKRYFFALDMDKVIDGVTNGCHTCHALKAIPKTVKDQSTGDPPESVGIAFAADVLKRERQLILVVREYVTSYTTACIVDSEKHQSLRDGILRLCVGSVPLDGPLTVVRTDPAPGFVALIDDDVLRTNRIVLEIGRVKNVNKNPVAEKAIRELATEIVKQNPVCGLLNDTMLAMSCARLNSRIRSRGLSAREMFCQRDQFTNEQIPLKDQELIMAQHNSSVLNHPHSERAKVPSGKRSQDTNVQIGDLVYLYCDSKRDRARDRYLVVSLDGSWCSVRKFVGSQLRANSYRVRRNECYKVPDQLSGRERDCDYPVIMSDEEDCVKVPGPPVPSVPPVLSDPSIRDEADGDRGTVEGQEHVDIEIPNVSGEIPNVSGDSELDNVSISEPPDLEMPVRDHREGSRRSGRKRQSPKWHRDYNLQ